MERKLDNNVKLDYIYTFLKNFDISSGIWVLYMVYKGLPLWQVGIAEAIFHIASFLFEVPSGALADLFGRKKTIIIGRICAAISCLINLFANNLLMFSIGFIVSALGYNMNSGSEEALVYDSLKLNGKEKNYIKINGRLNFIIEVSQGISVFIGGIISEISFELSYIFAIIVVLISLLPAIKFTEAKIEDEEKQRENISIKGHFITVYCVLKNHADIRRILFYYPIVFAFATVVFFYGQEYFSQFGLNKIEISIVMFINSVLSCIGALASDTIMKLFKNRTKYIVSMLMGMSIIVFSMENLLSAIITFCNISFANAILYPIQSTTLNELIPSEQRATIISVESMLFSLVMIVIFPLCGFIADILGLHRAFFILGILQIGFMIVLLRIKKIKLKIYQRAKMELK